MINFKRLTGSFFCAIAAFALAPANFGQPTSPPSDGLVLWLRSDAGVVATDGTVTSWEDQSGNFNHAIAPEGAEPTLVEGAINGLPALQFDGITNNLAISDSVTLLNYGDLTSFFVVKFDDFATFRSVWAKTDVNHPSPTDYYLLPGSGIPRLIRGDGETQLASVDGSRPAMAGRYAVIGFKHDFDEGTFLSGPVTHYMQGDPNGGGMLNSAILDEGLPLRIGTRDDFGTWFKGEMAELLIYNAALSEEDIASLNAYLENKYGLENERPAISITSPEHNSSVAAPAEVTVSANATDADGIARVQFFMNGTPVATATKAPYSFRISVETPIMLRLTAVATDALGKTNVSSEVVVNVTGETPAFEASSTLKLWLKGDTGVITDTENFVTEWQDQSGNNNHAVQTDPASTPAIGDINGEPSVRFDGADTFPDFLEINPADSLAITGDIATFAVARFDDFATYRAVWGQTAVNVPRPNDWYLQPNSGRPVFFRGAGTPPGQNPNVVAAGGVPVNAPLLLGVQQSGTTLTHYLNGRPFGSGQITLTPEYLGDPLRIGSRNDLVTKMRGDIAELMIFDGALSDEELIEVRRYLGTKYNIPLTEILNTSPEVQISSPSTGSEYPVPSTVSLSATAADEDGSVASVTYIANGQPIGTVSEAPFALDYTVSEEGQYEIVARVTDNLGRTANSAPITIVAGDFEPLPIPAPNLQLWLRADEGLTVNPDGTIMWEDVSNNDNHAVQTDPLLAPALVEDAVNGMPALRFDGSDDYLRVAHNPSLAIVGDISSFFVVRIEDYAGYRAVWAKTENNQPRPTDFYFVQNSGVPRLYRGGPGGIAPADGSTVPPLGEYLVYGFRQAGTTVSHFLNGQPNGGGQLDVPEADAGTDLLIGTRGDFFTKMFGQIAELVIYNRSVSDQEQQQIYQYFGQKYGLVTPPVEGPEITVTQGDGTITISWPAAAGNFQVEATDALGSGTWDPVAEAVVPSGNMNTVTVSTSGDARFFRLQSIP